MYVSIFYTDTRTMKKIVKKQIKIFSSDMFVQHPKRRFNSEINIT